MLVIKTAYKCDKIGILDIDGFYSYPVLIPLFWRIRGNKNKKCSKLFKPNYAYNHFVTS
jgi:hypothetical protein